MPDLVRMPVTTQHKVLLQSLQSGPVHFIVDEYPEALKYIVNVVHDAIYMEVPNERLQDVVSQAGKSYAIGMERNLQERYYVLQRYPNAGRSRNHRR